jgi:hypothetical protein
MKRYKFFLLFLCCILLIACSGFESQATPTLPPLGYKLFTELTPSTLSTYKEDSNEQTYPKEILPVFETNPSTISNNISLTINSIMLINDDNDSNNNAEAYFVIFSTREYGDIKKSKLFLPPNTEPIQFAVGDTLNLSNYSLSINNILDNENVSIFLLGFDSDDQGDLTNFAIDAALAVAEEAIPGSSFVKFILSRVSGSALDWWQNEDLLGEYSLVLSRENEWMQGTHSVYSSNSNLQITFSIEYTK